MAYDNVQQILGKLEDHEKRIRALEGRKVKDLKMASLEEERKTNTRNKGEDLFPPIEKLLKDGFFAEWRTDIEVCNTLTLKLLTKKTPLRASVVNVLRAMVKKGLLIREKIQKGKRFILAYKQVS
ncbi:MAG: hypothetical protein PHF45_01635 [Candidatus Pacebacteria bacterium]|nr:hypothetical protein [Candidatus Paceibacterota bacterium]